MRKPIQSKTKGVVRYDPFGKPYVDSTAVQREQRRMASKLWKLRGNVSGLVALIHIQPHVPLEIRSRLLEMLNIMEVAYKSAIEFQFETARVDIINANPEIYGSLEEENKLRKANKVRAERGKQRKQA